MHFLSSILALTASTNSQTANKPINYQTPPYCGVPVVQPNSNIFDDLPLRTSHSLSQNYNKHKSKTDDGRASHEPGASSQNKVPPPFGLDPQRIPAGQSGYGHSGRGRPEPFFISQSSSTNEDGPEASVIPVTTTNPVTSTASVAITDSDIITDHTTTETLSTTTRDSELPDIVPASTTSDNTTNPYAQPMANKHPNITWRVVGGMPAVPHSWPWQAHLSVCGKWNGILECNVCGGSIVSAWHVVTAAHCIPENPTGSVILGAHTLSHGGIQRITVKKFTPHPSWNSPFKFDNDIAVLELEKEAKFTGEVSPICLPQESVCFTEGTPCVVTGWGLTNERGGFPDDLQEVAVKLIDRERCKQYSGYGHVTDRMTCAGYESGGRDACAGDSGGPLVCRAGPNGAWILYGIVSWGYGCARPGNPGVYAFVPALVEWVNEITKLVPVVKMEECHDGADYKPIPPPTEPPVSKSPARSDHREHHPAVLNCADPAGRGQSHSDSGEWKTDGYPTPYSNNQHCMYCVTPEEPGSYVEITIQEIQLDQKKNCHRKGDYVHIEPMNKDAYYMCQVKRNAKDTHKIINSDTVCLRFVSDNMKARAGVFATYRQILSPPSGCGGNQIIRLRENPSHGVQTIKSLNYPDKYPDRLAHQCSWLIQTEEALKDRGFKMQIDFLVLQLEKQDKSQSKTFFCQDSDRITIYGSTSCEPSILKKAPILYVLCGHYKPKDRPMIDINSQSACLVFDINGDGSRNGNGFHANVNLIKR